MHADKNQIELSLLDELEKRADQYLIGEPVIYSHIWSFLTEYRGEITKKRGPKISHQKRQENIENLAWTKIATDYEINKRNFSSKLRKMKTDDFKRMVILRDIAHAFLLAEYNFHKESVIISGSIIEELLRLYLKLKAISPQGNGFNNLIRACESNGLLKSSVRQLSDSIRGFRNLVHLENEKSKRFTISRSTAKGAFSSIFTIANDIEL